MKRNASESLITGTDKYQALDKYFSTMSVLVNRRKNP